MNKSDPTKGMLHPDIENMTARKSDNQKPTIVCLCGSTRFGEEFRNANLRETLSGKIVLSIGCNMKSDTEIFGHLPKDELVRIKQRLDELHKRKIDLADEVLILNVGGYIGESTLSELKYAIANNKKVRYIEDVPSLVTKAKEFLRKEYKDE